MELNEYQDAAQESNALATADPSRALHAALFGLASETGALLDIQKKELTDVVDIAVSNELFKQELGDLLWYVSRVAKARGFALEDIASHNLGRVADMWAPDDELSALRGLPVYDSEELPQERFPRRLTFEFTEMQLDRAGVERTGAIIKLIDVSPNAFPDGPVQRAPGKIQGFALPSTFDSLTDNHRRLDGYRYHDAIHIAFMAVLNWSATIRALLNIKRKSTPDRDEFDDSARPIFLEEGLAAVLAALAPRRMGFRAPSNVDGDTLAVARSCTDGLEVENIPGWLWRRAIVQGFAAFRALHDNHGGTLIADLDAREVKFVATAEPITSA